MTVPIDHAGIIENLMAWWRINQRQFPWRRTQNPYHILVSEVLLHRTRAEQVVPVYVKFLKKFPSISKLSRAPREQVQKILYPLGLRWRSRLIHRMARLIVSRYHGRIVDDVNELKSLPGVSDYIASAVVCFAFGRPEVLLDTNTVRIIGRIFGIRTTDASRRSKYLKELYISIMDKKSPREFNYAMIDLGALLCTSRNPRCSSCPLVRLCRYGVSRLGG